MNKFLVNDGLRPKTSNMMLDMMMGAGGFDASDANNGYHRRAYGRYIFMRANNRNSQMNAISIGRVATMPAARGSRHQPTPKSAYLNTPRH